MTNPSVKIDHEKGLRPSISGAQRLQNIIVKNRLITDREFRKFMAGDIPIMPCSGDRERHFIISEFERLAKAAQS